MLVDPNNRLVADTLEEKWNEKLSLAPQHTLQEAIYGDLPVQRELQLAAAL